MHYAKPTYLEQVYEPRFEPAAEKCIMQSLWHIWKRCMSQGLNQQLKNALCKAYGIFGTGVWAKVWTSSWKMYYANPMAYLEQVYEPRFEPAAEKCIMQSLWHIWKRCMSQGLNQQLKNALCKAYGIFGTSVWAKVWTSSWKMQYAKPMAYLEQVYELRLNWTSSWKMHYAKPMAYLEQVYEPRLEPVAERCIMGRLSADKSSTTKPPIKLASISWTIKYHLLKTQESKRHLMSFLIATNGCSKTLAIFCFNELNDI